MDTTPLKFKYERRPNAPSIDRKNPKLGRECCKTNNQILDGENINELARRIGEKIEAEIQRGRIAGVSSDMEALDYRFAAADLCAAGVSAPHKRQRLFWVGNSTTDGCKVRTLLHPRNDGHRLSQGCELGGMVQPNSTRPQSGGETTEATGQRHSVKPTSFWHDSMWRLCQDGKQRRIPRIESLFQCVADGVSHGMDGLRTEDAFPLCEKIQGRATLLKGYGNAICIPTAVEFIKAVMDVISDEKTTIQNESV
jgi:DNA (cytosine-5)-methyltransferase 1